MGKDSVAYDGEILVAGNDKLAYSISVCLLQAGHVVTLYTADEKKAVRDINVHVSDLREAGYKISGTSTLKIVDEIKSHSNCKLIIAVTPEDVLEKKGFIRDIEKRITSEAIVAINTESIPLYLLQEESRYPERIIGLNWVEPAHTTLFLELIGNSPAQQQHIDRVFALAKKSWRKDPYIISGNYGIRSRMFAAMVREAFYLVQHGYASIEDIDRACRNDAGYYLPFAGNCRYMDLMGTYAYGMVMKELNPELSTGQSIPDFFQEIGLKNGKGMESDLGFYTYSPGEAERWDTIFREFSYRIARIMERYPFDADENVTLKT